MAKIELSISSEYVPDWGLWEGIREIMQNAMDEDSKGHLMSISHSEEDSVLTVSNEGSTLSIRHLLVGYTTKAGDDSQRGEKGEGLDLGVLALARAGHDVVIRTPDSVWRPSLEPSDAWGGEKVLVFRTRKRPKLGSSTSITVSGVDADDWEEFKGRFLPDADILDNTDKDRHVCWHGSLLTSPEMRGKVFVKGIWIMDTDLDYGYDFKSASLNRDRNMVADWDFKYERGRIWSSMHDDDKLLDLAYDLIAKGSSEIPDVGLYLDFQEKIAKKFKKKYGDKVIPVGDDGEQQRVASMGRRAVVLPEVFLEIVASYCDDIDVVQAELKTNAKVTYPEDDLCDLELRNYQGGLRRISDAIDIVRDNRGICEQIGTLDLFGLPALSTFARPGIVEFGDINTLGQCDIKNKSIKIAKRVLANRYWTLATIVHEYAHLLAAASDVDMRHSQTIESLWTAIMYARDKDDEVVAADSGDKPTFLN